jgi:hypothetical protein
MSTSHQTVGSVGAPAPTYRAQPVQSWDETKLSLKTTEFWVLIATVLGVIIVARTSDYLDTQWATGFVVALSIGYMLSRGLAKAGSGHREDRDYD